MAPSKTGQEEADMELRNLEIDDLPLYEAIHCDPRMMEHLGGPLPREGLAEKLRRDVASVEAGDTWVLKIVPDEVGTAAGTVAVWGPRGEGGDGHRDRVDGAPRLPGPGPGE
jgi:hypothetical protein